MDTPVSAVDLDAAWADAKQQRRACRCAVCKLTTELRAWIDQRLAELDAAQTTGGVGTFGVLTLATQVTEPKLGISHAQLKKHHQNCRKKRCGVYDGQPYDLGA